jgi:single-strand DNA-binding protein
MSVRSLNKVMLIGNLTKDPVVRYTPTSTAVCSFSLATNRSWTPSEGGEKQEQVEYHNIVAWSKLAELCGQLLHKGDKVYVEGRLQTRDWKTNEGQDRRTTEIVIDNMLMLNSRPAGAAPYQAPTAPTAKPAKSKKAASEETTPAPEDEVEPDEVSEVEDVSEDIPF